MITSISLNFLNMLLSLLEPSLFLRAQGIKIDDWRLLAENIINIIQGGRRSEIYLSKGGKEFSDHCCS